ncbi:Thioredoxin reductase [Pedobacter sp. ok626]|uniref:NAD(P)/FAD-dependent oxidoreductase n=1 Tax=Pedobacter sp. ok626 TaxID=1761882 RepID=UPI00088DE82C|nr:NAD(P)/FAD-dependent oxidoreductase [Pedobacter sp. ok626]SDJ08444.1 Thioredoxin reductase [Pedobacter sp. ok626]
MEKNQNYDVVIIGGSYAGLSAALALGRAIRNVLVIDSGNPCNRQTPHSHNFLTQDGNTPAGIAALGKFEVMQYPTVEFLTDLVTGVKGENNNFQVITNSGKAIKARKLLFSTGVKDLLPEIPGFADCWGISVIHCPYCHGYEFKDQATGILANGDTAYEMASMINNWTKKLTVFTNGKAELTEVQLQQLSTLKIDVIEKPLQDIEHKGGAMERVLFTDGSSHMLNALYARPPFVQHCPVPKEIGCEINKMGYIQVDDLQKTTVAGVFAAGDNTSKFRAVSAAVAAGGKAGAFINHELIAHG